MIFAVFDFVFLLFFFFFKQKTAYEMRISDWSSDVCSSDLGQGDAAALLFALIVEQAELDLFRILGEQREVHAAAVEGRTERIGEIGRASCRERVCQYV